MTGISPTTQLVATIRQHVAGSAHVVQARSKTAPTRGQGTQQNKERSLAELVGQRIRAIDRDDPRRHRKAFRAFLESVLLGQLGIQLINDPAFYSLVDEVHRTMESDLALAPQIEEAGKQLFNSQFQPRDP